MISTNPRNFRAELKTQLDHARQEPIRVIRRSKEGFVLMSEEHFEKMRKELNELQNQLLDGLRQ